MNERFVLVLCLRRRVLGSGVCENSADAAVCCMILHSRCRECRPWLSGKSHGSCQFMHSKTVQNIFCVLLTVLVSGLGFKQSSYTQNIFRQASLSA